MVSDYVQTEHDCRRLRICEDNVGLGSYTMDSHNVQRFVTPEGLVQNEGDVQVPAGGSYAISYKAIVPKQGEAENLLVPVCLSSSHIAYGGIRMEPVFMVLGQSAATAAALAIDADVPVQEVDYNKLRQRLEADGQQLTPQGAPRVIKEIRAESLAGVVVDDRQAKFVGEWTPGNTTGPSIGVGYHHDGNDGKGIKTATFRAELKPGTYEVRLAYSTYNNRATNVPVVITHAEGEARVVINQRKAPTLDQAFISLGTYTFEKTAMVQLQTAGTDGHVIADAVQFLPVR